MRLDLSNRLYQPILQNSQQLGLCGYGKLSKLIKKKGPLIRRIELANLVVDRARKGSFLVTEQQAFDKVFWNRCTIYSDKGLSRP
jgi:hypothetical protein